MENKIIIKSADDTDLPVYVYEPNGIRIGAIVLIQEIFGVTDHIKSVAEKFSNEGFIVWVPEIYHRLDGNIQLEYDITSVTEGKRLKKECENGSRIIFFACSVYYSKQICAFLTLLKIKAAHIDGTVSNNRRKKLINDFVKEGIQVICNYEILSTGFDAPKTDVVFISRPTFSIVLYAQMIGRGLRGPAIGGSKTCKIIDVKDNMQGYSNEDLVYDYFQEYFIN